MKLTLLLFSALVLFCVQAYAQNPFVEALAASNPRALADLKPERPEDQIHKDLILATIDAARGLNVRIDREAAPLLDEIYVNASKEVAEQSESSPKRRLFPANQTRFIARLISLAEPHPESARIIPKTIELLKKELRDHVAGFCPCFPFC